MPNLELTFHVHDKTLSRKTMRRAVLLGYKERREKFTKEDLRSAVIAIGDWMKEHNKKVDESQCRQWVCPDGCSCHE